MDAVHRLDGGGCSFVLCLRYSRSRRESELADEGLLFLNCKDDKPRAAGGLQIFFVVLGLNASSWFLPKFPSG